MGRKVKTAEFRASFCNVFEAKGFDGGEPKFSIAMIFPKDADLSELRAIAKEAVREKFGDKAPANLRSPFRDGAEKGELEGYGDGVIFVNASSKQQPGIVDAKLQRVMSRDEFYAGCYARATVTAYAYDQKGNKGVAFGLHNLQKLRDGERLDGKAAAEKDFDAVDVVKADDDFMA